MSKRFSDSTAAVARAVRLGALLLVLGSAAGLAQASWESGFKGTLELGDSVSGVTGAASEDFVNFHTYALYVPPGVAELEIELGALGDLDLAWKSGSVITSYSDDADYVDLSDAHGGTYYLENPAAGPLFIDVINFHPQGFAYDLNVRASGGEDVALVGGWPEVAPAAGVWPEAVPFATVGRLAAGTAETGNLLNDDSLAGLSFHTWLFEVPAGTERFSVLLESPEPLSLALKSGDPITGYGRQDDGGDWDYWAWGQQGVPQLSITVTKPETGTWYLDVINDESLPEGRYNLRLDLD